MAKDQDNKIDLSELNKTKRQLKLPKIRNPFSKKSAGPDRDEFGKFTSGSGGLLSSKKLNMKRVVPIVAVVSLVGGFFVFQSFANTKPPAYQYSIHTCKNSKITENDLKDAKSELSKCVDQSAEAFAYRVQLAALGRQTDWGYGSLPQRLAGDRNTVQRVSEIVEALPEARWGGLSDKDYVDRVAGLASPAQRAQWTKDIQEKKMSRDQLAENVAALFKVSKNRAMMNSYRFNNKQFVEHIFKKLLKRGDSYVANENSSWLKDLNSEKYTRGQVLSLVAQSQEARDKSRIDMIKYVNSKPKAKIVQTVKNEQTKRNQRLATLVSNAKTHREKGSQHHQKAIAGLLKKATPLESPRTPSANQVNELVLHSRDAANRVKNAKTSSDNAEKVRKEAETVVKKAEEVSKRSPDISSAAARESYNKIYMYAAAAKNDHKAAQRDADAIAGKQRSAKNKFDAEQRRVAEERRKSEQQSSGGGSGYNGSASQIPPEHRCLLNGSCPTTGSPEEKTCRLYGGTWRPGNICDRYPQYTMCKGMSDGRYWDYSYGTSESPSMPYYEIKREVTCGRGYEMNVSTWSKKERISKSNYMYRKLHKDIGLFDKH